MNRVPSLHIPNLFLRFQNKMVNRFVVVHPASVQYVQHDPTTTELRIRYITGDEMSIQDKKNPESMKKMFDSLVDQLSKDATV
jgi:hypothetical protein